MLSNGPGPERGLLSRFLDLIRGSRAPGSGETDLRRALEARSTEDLSSILQERDEAEWRPEVFEVVASILDARGVSPSPREAEPRASPAESPGVPDVQPLVTVGRYFSPTEAHSYCMALEGAGLRAWVFDEAGGSYLGVGIGSRLQVRAEDEAAARALLDAGAAPDSVSPVEPAEPAEPARGHSWSESPDDREVTAAMDTTVPETAEPIREEAATEEDGRSRGREAVELVGVVLITSVYPALCPPRWLSGSGRSWPASSFSWRCGFS